MLHIVEQECDIEPVGPEPRIRRSYHLCFRVDDISATRSILEKNRITYSTDSVPGTDMQQLFCYDPDGNGIELQNSLPCVPKEVSG
uniref:Glyoxalase family protein n=1 Tax=Tetraselmis sp. GSL018 TaxID=582737 RepID=A0A061R781_9CHLO|mmetsp:Transcript_241/g.473  ORF Transcript_241/g.473 Transcript_241/m.473 type:complete len:86 (+) Transcript_241:504-761(+)